MHGDVSNTVVNEELEAAAAAVVRQQKDAGLTWAAFLPSCIHALTMLLPMSS
jgi:hypothetical protein